MHCVCVSIMVKLHNVCSMHLAVFAVLITIFATCTPRMIARIDDKGGVLPMWTNAVGQAMSHFLKVLGHIYRDALKTSDETQI